LVINKDFYQQADGGGNSYKHPTYACGSNEAKSFLNFFPSTEIEVYTKE